MAKKGDSMKKLLLLCAMVTSVSMYGASIGRLSQAAAEQKAQQLVAQYGPNLDQMHVEGYTNTLTGSLRLGQNAVDPVDLVVDTIKTANRIFAANPGDYWGLPADLQEHLRYLTLYDRARLAEIKRELAAKGL
jgi:hypothetical protein